MSNRSVLRRLGAKGHVHPTTRPQLSRYSDGLTLLEDLGPVNLDQTRLSILVLLAVIHGGQGDDGAGGGDVNLGKPGCCCSGKQVEARTIEVRNNGLAAAMNVTACAAVRCGGQQISPTRDVANSTRHCTVEGESTEVSGSPCSTVPASELERLKAPGKEPIASFTWQVLKRCYSAQTTC